MNLDKTHIVSVLSATMEDFIEQLQELPTVSINHYNPNTTLVVMIDMINGFCKFGPLSSPYVNRIVPAMADFLDDCIRRKIPIISYQDAHPTDAAEFNFFPAHCVANTAESELVDELVRPELIVVPKNSTNAFLAQNPLALVDHKIKNILVIGCVTDICIRDFSTTMHKYLQQNNINCTVNVIENLIDTYDLPGMHDRQVEHLLALYQMRNAGIELIRV